MRKILSVMLVLLLALGIGGGLSASAASACPGMPKGAENLFKPDTMKKLGDDFVAVYAQDTLLTESRSIHETYGKMAVSFDFNAKMKKEFVFSFWGKANSDGLRYMIRIMDDGAGGYCEVEFNRTQAVVFSTLDGSMERLSRPSSKMCMATPNDSKTGDWRHVQLRVKPGTAKTELMMYVDGEQLKTGAGAGSIRVATDEFSLMIGTSAVMTMRGMRVYEVDNKAKEFEPDFDPDKELKEAEDGTDGDDGGTGVVRIPTDTGDEGETGATGGNGGHGGKGDKGDGKQPELGLILGIAGGAVAVIAIVLIAVLVSKKKKAALADEQTAEKEGDDQ